MHRSFSLHANEKDNDNNTVAAWFRETWVIDDSNGIKFEYHLHIITKQLEHLACLKVWACHQPNILEHVWRAAVDRNTSNSSRFRRTHYRWGKGINGTRAQETCVFVPKIRIENTEPKEKNAKCRHALPITWIQFAQQLPEPNIFLPYIPPVLQRARVE